MPYGKATAVWLRDNDTSLHISDENTNLNPAYAREVWYAEWDGRNWSPLGSGVNDGVHALAVMGSDLYAGGNFTAAGDIPSVFWRVVLHGQQQDITDKDTVRCSRWP